MTTLLELPAFYVDAVLFDELGLGAGAVYLDVIDRNPDPNETEVRVDALISFNIAGSLANPPVLADTVISVQVTAADGTVGPIVTAYDGGAGGFQAGFNGANSATALLDAQTRSFVIDATLAFESQSTLTIYVSTDAVGYAGVYTTSWSFTIEDVTAPQLTEAKARTSKIVRLTFDEPVEQSTTTGTDSALNPDNYTFTTSTIPAVSVVASSVETVGSHEVDVTLDIEMTPGATYLVVATDIEDLLNNVIVAPFNQTTFTGFAPATPLEREFNLWEMIPEKNRDEDDGTLYLFLACLQEVTDLQLSLIDSWTDILDPDLAPEIFVDAMLQDLGNPFDFDLSLVDKRKLVKILVEIYKQKGTGVGIINVVRFFLDIEITINAFSDEGWDLGIDELGDSLVDGTAILGPGTSYALYSFEVVSPVILTATQREQITTIANYMKPAHTHLISIVEPTTPTIIDHLELGLSVLGDGEWWLH
jgi:phage tail-like protein